MKLRFIVEVILLASFLGGPKVFGECPVRLKKVHCSCCASTTSSCCKKTLQSQCGIPQLLDRCAPTDSKSPVATQFAAVFEILFFPQVHFYSSISRFVEQIPSPPPREMNCIRLI
jgi:hypothetical protein